MMLVVVVVERWIEETRERGTKNTEKGNQQ